jgi:serine/threonine protein phosphatase 1
MTRVGTERLLTVAVGDVHGRADLLDILLREIRARWGDRLAAIVFVGDYVDRGPDSAGVVRRLRALENAFPGVVHCLRGNHEEMLLACLQYPELQEEWLQRGGLETLDSFRVPTVAALPQDVLDWLRRLPSQWEDPLRYYVHAGFHPGLPVSWQKDQHRLWIREPFLSADHDFGKHVVHGHSPVKARRGKRPLPDARRFRTNLDTGAVFSGVLSAALFDNAGAEHIGVLQAVDGGAVDWLPAADAAHADRRAGRRRFVAAALVAAGLAGGAGFAMLRPAPDAGTDGTVGAMVATATTPEQASAAERSRAGDTEPLNDPDPPTGTVPDGRPGPEGRATAPAIDPLAAALLPWSAPADGRAAAVPPTEQAGTYPLSGKAKPERSSGTQFTEADAHSPATMPVKADKEETTFAAFDRRAMDMAAALATADSAPRDEAIRREEPGEGATAAAAVDTSLPHIAESAAPRAEQALRGEAAAAAPAPGGNASPDAVDAAGGQLFALADLIPPVAGLAGLEPPAPAAPLGAHASGAGPLLPQAAGTSAQATGEVAADEVASDGPAAANTAVREGRDAAAGQPASPADPSVVSALADRGRTGSIAKAEPLATERVPQELARLLEQVPPVAGPAGLDPAETTGVPDGDPARADLAKDHAPAEAAARAGPDEVMEVLAGLVELVPPVETLAGLEPDVPAGPRATETAAAAAEPASPPALMVSRPTARPLGLADRKGRAVRRTPSARVATRPTDGFGALLFRLFSFGSADRRIAARRPADCAAPPRGRRDCGLSVARSSRDSVAAAFGVADSGRGPGASAGPGEAGASSGAGASGAGAAATSGSDTGGRGGPGRGNGRGNGNGGGNGGGRGGRN